MSGSDVSSGPEGELVTGPPDFVGVGTQRSGTTWWQRILMDHPSIHLPRDRRKEQHFFDWFGKTQMSDADIARYHEQFPRAPGHMAGEWTPRYMRDVWTPRLLARAAPDAKILVMFRDPVERYRSGVLHTVARRPGRDATYLSTDGVERGRYALEFRRLLDYFDRDQILVIQFERCIADPLAQYRRTLEFLGADPDHVAKDLTRTRGTPTTPRREEHTLWDDIRYAVTRELEPDVAELRELLPEIDVELWPNFKHLATGEEPATPEPPRISVGGARTEKGAPPDFVGVGTTHSNFAWWNDLLLEHPAIRRPGGKRNRNFFATFCKRAMTEEDIEAYHARFRRHDDKIVGEWSPHYMYDTWTPMLLQHAAPDAKLLVMLVDPITRYLKLLAESEGRRPAEERVVNRAAETDYLSNGVPRGCYGRQLQRLLRYYERDQILVLQYERCLEDPVGEYARTLRFLGVDDTFRPSEFGSGAQERVRHLLKRAKRRPQARIPTPSIDLWPDVEIPLLKELEADVLELRNLVPDLDLSLWPKFAHLAEREAPGAGETVAGRA